MSSSFDRIPEPGIPPAPKGFVPIQEIEEKALDPHWEISDVAWDWNLGLLDDRQLLRRYHDAAAELTAQALTFDEHDRMVPRDFSQKELDAANALQHYWQTVCEIKVRKAVREVLAAVAQEQNSAGGNRGE